MGEPSNNLESVETEVVDDSNSNERISKRVLMIISLGLGVLVLGTLALLLFDLGPESAPSSDADDSHSSFVFFPIYFGALVPLLAARKRDGEKKDLNKKEKFLLVAVFGLVLLVMLGTLAFIILAR